MYWFTVVRFSIKSQLPSKVGQNHDVLCRIFETLVKKNIIYT